MQSGVFTLLFFGIFLILHYWIYASCYAYEENFCVEVQGVIVGIEPHFAVGSGHFQLATICSQLVACSSSQMVRIFLS
jgi:hypothetical protein